MDLVKQNVEAIVAVATSAALLSEASRPIGAHRLHPFEPELPDRLLQAGELTLLPVVNKLVRQSNRATLGGCSPPPVESSVGKALCRLR